jgi:DnaD/phage-associated family protein
MNGLRETGSPPEEALKKALDKAARRGTLLHIALERDGTTEDIYLLNTDSDREAIVKIQSGELQLQGLKFNETITRAETEPQPNIFVLYEENIGMLTPIIADELREAEKEYPEEWIKDAIKEAVRQNKRKWGYIAVILERWATQGRNDGTYKRDSKEAGPEKYYRQRYGHMARH